MSSAGESPPEIIQVRTYDGYSLACRRYAPPAGTRPRGLVLVLHGIQSHGGWYEASSRRLAAAGLAVYFPDRRGSGLNAPARGDSASWELLIDDLVAVEERALADWFPTAGRLPLLLVGISWGGKLATAAARMHAGRYAALALLCPGICPQLDVPFATKFRIAAALAGGGGSRPFPIPLDDPSLFTSTPRWLDFLARDQLSLHEATARFLAQSRRLDSLLATTPEWLHLPTYLALAGRDRIIDNESSRRWFDRVASPERTLKVYPEAQHTLEFEPEPQPIFDDLAAWLLARCGRKQGVVSSSPLPLEGGG
jgi:alpha-beta hydrolase superfamily lysophospholipase